MPSPLTHDEPETIGPYRPVVRLGSGGVGTVYLARNAGGRTVALKTMHARIASDPAFRTRFRLETDAARVVGERYGAGVVDADPRAETPWFASEYVLGPPLDEAVELCGPLLETSVRVLGAALCGALAQLHASDVVHRDLKPSNILITAYGPKVVDFGIARAAGDDRLTRIGVAVGTPAFMSPEQAGGQEHSTAGDVFALAGVLVFAATGHPGTAGDHHLDRARRGGEHGERPHGMDGSRSREGAVPLSRRTERHRDLVYALGCDTQGYGYPMAFDVRSGKKRWEGGVALGSNDNPVLRQGHGVWLLDHGAVPTVSATGTENDARETWSYKPTDRAASATFATAGNRVFVTCDSSLYALPVF
ncbi:serine/threonine-protein kinase [Streptomyces sp. NPDC001356]